MILCIDMSFLERCPLPHWIDNKCLPKSIKSAGVWSNLNGNIFSLIYFIFKINVNNIVQLNIQFGSSYNARDPMFPQWNTMVVGLRWPSGLERQFSRSWKRKVVGSNLGGAWFSSMLFFCGDRLKKGDLTQRSQLERQQCDAKQEAIWINLLQMAPSNNFW